jgi:hypothetical protein
MLYPGAYARSPLVGAKELCQGTLVSMLLKAWFKQPEP